MKLTPIQTIYSLYYPSTVFKGERISDEYLERLEDSKKRLKDSKEVIYNDTSRTAK